MEPDRYIMLAERVRQLKERNKEIEILFVTYAADRLCLEQELNRNKLEIQDIYVKLKKAEKEMNDWQGLKHE